MVTKIPKPDDESIEILNHVLGERVKFKKFYDRITIDLTARYRQYDIQKGCPTGMPPLVLRNYVDTDHEAIERKKSLIGLYNPEIDKYPFHELEKLRKKINFLPALYAVNSEDREHSTIAYQKQLTRSSPYTYLTSYPRVTGAKVRNLRTTKTRRVREVSCIRTTMRSISLSIQYGYKHPTSLH